MVIIIFGLPLTYAYATLRQSVAGNSTFRGIFAIQVPLKQSFQISSPRGKLRPHIFPHMVTPTMFPWDKKTRGRKMRLSQKCINSLVSHKLSHDCQFWFFFLGALTRVPTRRCDLVVPADWGWGCSIQNFFVQNCTCGRFHTVLYLCFFRTFIYGFLHT